MQEEGCVVSGPKDYEKQNKRIGVGTRVGRDSAVPRENPNWDEWNHSWAIISHFLGLPFHIALFVASGQFTGKMVCRT